MFSTIFLLLFFSFTITFILTPITINFARKFGLVTDASNRPHPAHTHKGIIPRAGGIPLFLGLFIPTSLLIPINRAFIGIIIGSIILIIVGIWDDLKDRSPYIRLATNVVVAIIVISSGMGIPYITNPFDGIIQLDRLSLVFDFMGKYSIPIFSSVLALLWIVWATNIVGWSGGVDGQLPGFVAISALVIGILSLRFSINDPNQTYVTYLSFSTSGAFLGFLPWNFYPQKIMPGYGGKTLAGFMLAVLSILSFSKLGTAILVLALPLTDASFMLIKRILSGKSPVAASYGHLHHHLLELKWSKRKIAAFYWLISALAGVVALTLTSTQKVFAAILILVIIAGFILFVNFLAIALKRKVDEGY